MANGKFFVRRSVPRTTYHGMLVRRGRTEEGDATKGGREIGGAKITRCKEW